MHRILLAGAMALALSACAAPSGDMGTALGRVGAGLIVGTHANPVTRDQVYIAANAFNAAEATATNYIRLPRCLAGQSFIANRCSTRAAIARLAVAVRAGRNARNALEAWIKTRPATISGGDLYAGLSGAVADIKAVLTAYGVAAS